MKLKRYLFVVWGAISVTIFFAVSHLQSAEVHPQLIYINFFWAEFIFSVFIISTYIYLVSSSDRPCAQFDSWFYGVITLYAGVSTGVLLINGFISVNYVNRTWLGEVFFIVFVIFALQMMLISAVKRRFLKKVMGLKSADSNASENLESSSEGLGIPLKNRRVL